MNVRSICIEATKGVVVGLYTAGPKGALTGACVGTIGAVVESWMVNAWETYELSKEADKFAKLLDYLCDYYNKHYAKIFTRNENTL